MAMKEVVINKDPEQIGTDATSLPATTVSPIPPLQSGDRLTRYEFERRYEAMPHLKKAELIEGVVYVPSPVTVFHSKSHMQLIAWLGTYQAATPGVEGNDNATIRLDADNEVQPDGLLRLESELGGTSKVSDDGYIEGAPELIVEVAYSSAAYDLHDKLHVYRRNGVQEYIIWQVFDERLDWFRLSDEGEYVALASDEQGVIRSQIFPGLNLKVTALLSNDLTGVLAVLQQGLEMVEYKMFVEQLANKAIAGK
jgi:Uma2 family endonuclease